MSGKRATSHPKPSMTTVLRSVSDIIATNDDAPLPLSVIPNHMGINLCSVDAMSWTKQADGQLVSLTIHFLPATKAEMRARRRKKRAR